MVHSTVFPIREVIEGSLAAYGKGSGREKDLSSYLSRDINLCWTNWPCCEDNVTAGVSAETGKNQSKVKEKNTLLY